MHMTTTIRQVGGVTIVWTSPDGLCSATRALHCAT